MAEVNMEKARQVFQSLCSALDAGDLRYQRDEENLRIEFTIRGKDLPIYIRIKVIPTQQLVLLLSEVPYRFPEDKRVDGAIAVSIVNDRLANGCFDYDVRNGSIWFRMTNSYIDSDLSKDLFDYMVNVSCNTVDDFNDKFVSIGLGSMDVSSLFPEE